MTISEIIFSVVAANTTGAMRKWAGLRNAILILLMVIAAHVVISSRSQVDADGRPTPTRISSSNNVAVARRARKKCAASDGFVRSWPPSPEASCATSAAFEPPLQRPYTREDEERAALHRLVFSQPEMANEYPRLSAPRDSGWNVSSGCSMDGPLPMYYINDSDAYAGIESWGAGYTPVAF